MSEQQESLISLEEAKELVTLLECGQVEMANEIITKIQNANSDALFEKVGVLTRQLHDSLEDFQLDTRIESLANDEFPDARERLNYVIEMTDKAANRTMDAVEACLPIADSFNDRIQQVMPNWKNLMSRDLQLGQFKELCKLLDDFLQVSVSDADSLRQYLTEILMAQDFQDLTGQMIRRVINLVQEVEVKLVEMLTMFGEASRPLNVITESVKKEISGIEAEGPIMNASERVDVVDGQNDVDDLLSSLGF
ncbi:protein phosphatase CheZ [Moritella viscosa]|uniref:Protein phosphatase CheZ n=1 Tax=Moritella viscosa TaxID=80854 RepID=A0A090KBI5_9GAMM|nr:protein phosphatase CheZ [Moritella viscosa]CED61233.1 chemotaxis protein CheZ [Moritella viscosa]SGY88092.1 Chemotaxis protein CheZ [Moritella viscosa]SGY91307.1 Chemotaxis protein CheZ [Moritella viscosa]SGY91338.1 Chemotaxis protein CheZ [Moritella viscosa]SGY94370.1 Chemotaxis protein CheZ [Moritella viscosa]